MNRFLLIVLPILLFSCCGVLHAQDSLNLSLIGQLENNWWADDANDIAISGDYAYLSTPYNGIKIVDISDPTAPEEVGQYPVRAYCNDLEIVGSELYIVTIGYDDPPTEPGLYILDISNPAELELLSNSLGSQGLYVDVEDELLVDGSRPAYSLVDVSDPENPETLSISAPDNVWYGSVTLEDTLLFLANERFGIHIIDVVDPELPVEIGSVEIQDGAADLSIRDSLVYIASNASGLAIVEINDPSNPTLISQTNFRWRISGISVTGNYAYLTARDETIGTPVSVGILIVDISDPENPFLVATIPSGQRIIKHPIEVVGSTFFIADHNNGLHIYDMTDPTAPDEIGYVDSPSNGTEIEVTEDTVFVLMNDNLWTIDVSDPTIPQVVSYFRFHYHYFLHDMLLENNRLWFPTSNNTLLQLDISNSASPVMLDTIPLARRSQNLHNLGDAIYVKADSMIYVIDASDEDNVFVTDSLEYSGRFIDMKTKDDYLYVCVSGHPLYLYIYDVQDPLSPLLIATEEYQVQYQSLIDIQDNYLYLLQFNEIIKLNISNPEEPEYIGRFSFPNGYLTDMRAMLPWEGYVVLGQHVPEDVIYIFDLSIEEHVDSTQAQTVAYYSDNSRYLSHRDMEKMDEYIVSAGSGGLSIFQPDLPQGITDKTITSIVPAELIMEPVFPNPANGTVSFSISTLSPGIAYFSITNIIGKQILTFERFYSAGEHKVSLEMNNLKSISSGYYFITSHFKGYEATAQVILLK